MSGEFEFNAWVQADARLVKPNSAGECHATKQQETRSWERTVFVPGGMQPIDVIRQYSGNLPLPPFHALQLTINKHDVECIASAMVNPNLQWRNMFHFTIAPYDGQEKAFRGEWILMSGHHRFLAFLLSGASPTEECPLRVSKAPFATSLFPWTSVIWGK